MIKKTTLDTRDAEWLYKQLTQDEDDFCDSLLSLAKGAMVNPSQTPPERMWGIYLSLMDRIGQELFGVDLCLPLVSETVGSAEDTRPIRDYASTVQKLLMGAYLLFDQIRPPKFRARLTTLKNLSRQHHAVILRYLNGELPFAAEQEAPWGYINHSHLCFSEVYDMVREAVEDSREALLSAEERSALLKKQFENELDRIFEELFSSEPDKPKPKSKKIYRIVSHRKGKK